VTVALHPFRFGVTAPTVLSGPAWVERARRIEQLGYSIVHVPDHFRDQLAPVPALTAAAMATTRLRVGSLVFSNDFRHPVVLAKEAATIDVLSSGRFELGLGSGWLREEYDQAGISFDAPGTRIERLTEAVSIVKGLLGDAPVTFAGRHYTITALQGRPSPVQRPHPPILIGGGGQRTLSLAAREAAIVGLVPRARRDGGGLERGDFGEAALREKVGRVRDDAVPRRARGGARESLRADRHRRRGLRNAAAAAGVVRGLVSHRVRSGSGDLRAGGGAVGWDVRELGTAPHPALSPEGRGLLNPLRGEG